MSKLNVDEIRSADRSTSSSANMTFADDGNASLGGTLSAGTLGSSVVFPAGHVLQVSQTNFHTEYTRTSTSFGAFNSALGHTITGCTTGNKILIDINLSYGCDGGGGRHVYFRLIDKTNSDATIGQEASDGLFGGYMHDAAGSAKYGHHITSFKILYTPSSFNSGSFQFEIYAKSHVQNTIRVNRRGEGDAYGRLTSSLTLWEIQS